MMRITRSAVLEVLGQEHVRVARAKGLRAKNVLQVHVLPNAAIPIITVAGRRESPARSGEREWITGDSCG